MYTNFIKTYDIIDVSSWENCYELPEGYSNPIEVNGYFYAFSTTNVKRTSNGIMWKNVSDFDFGTIKCITNLIGRFVSNGRVYHTKTLIIGSNGIISSYNMKEYNLETTNLSSTTINRINDICGFNGKYYACTNNGRIYISNDGITWSNIDIGGIFYSIDSNNQGIFVGGRNVLYKSNNGEEFEQYIDESETIPSDYTGKFVKAISSGNCYISDGSTIYITDMFEYIKEVNHVGSIGTIKEIIVDSNSGCYVSTSNGFWYNINEIIANLTKLINDSNLVNIFITDNTLISMDKRQYFKFNQESQLDYDIPVFSSSTTARETIIKQINLANSNDEDAIYYDDEGNELDGTAMVRCFIKGNNDLHYRLIPDMYALDTNSSIYLLSKPLILNKDEQIYFSSIIPNVSITIVYSYGA